MEGIATPDGANDDDLTTLQDLLSRSPWRVPPDFSHHDGWHDLTDLVPKALTENVQLSSRDLRGRLHIAPQMCRVEWTLGSTATGRCSNPASHSFEGHRDRGICGLVYRKREPVGRSIDSQAQAAACCSNRSIRISARRRWPIQAGLMKSTSLAVRSSCIISRIPPENSMSAGPFLSQTDTIISARNLPPLQVYLGAIGLLDPPPPQLSIPDGRSSPGGVVKQT